MTAVYQRRLALGLALVLSESNDAAGNALGAAIDVSVLVRSLRLRHLWLGSPISLEALFDVFDLYGQTSYLNMIAYVQLLVGPAPYGIHLLNSAFYLAGALVLHRVVLRASLRHVGRPGHRRLRHLRVDRGDDRCDARAPRSRR
jgi:hypothetical protein